jgi:hypothetical protein
MIVLDDEILQQHYCLSGRYNLNESRNFFNVKK